MPPRIDQTTLQSCDLCKRKKVPCSGEQPCTNCYNSNECKYTMERHRPTLLASSVPQSRRLSSGSACETCRRRKTKCDGQQPCNYCSTNGIECLNNSERRKRGLPPVAVMPMKNQSSHKRGQFKAKLFPKQVATHGWSHLLPQQEIRRQQPITPLIKDIQADRFKW